MPADGEARVRLHAAEPDRRHGGIVVTPGQIAAASGSLSRRFEDDIRFHRDHVRGLAEAQLGRGAFGDPGRVEQRRLAEGGGAFDELLHGRSAPPGIVLRP